MAPSLRVTIRASHYNGRDGFTVTWRREVGWWPSRVFVEHRWQADALRTVVKQSAGDTDAVDRYLESIWRNPNAA